MGDRACERGEDPPTELKAAYEWVTMADRPLGDLADAEVFEDVLYRVSYKLDGTPAAGDTYKRRRRALNAALEHAVATGNSRRTHSSGPAGSVSAPTTWLTRASW
ncbi:hypothetical protein ACFQ0G_19280 [Streptomyces chiangmaiensis]